jgi:tRNA dimethylallyltransferase
MMITKNNIAQPDRSVVVVGPTGSGKTAVSIEIAQKIGGEIISADSRAIYKYMDIGTAKPSKGEQETVPHWGLDFVEPGERFTVDDWKEYAEQKIYEIQRRGNIPIVAGGTGLYIDALIYDYQFRGPTGEKAEKGDFEQKNCSDRKEMSSDFVVFGIKTEPEILRQRIQKRVNKLFAQKELFIETEFLVKKYGWDSQAMKSNIYQFAWRYMQGEISLEEAKRLNFYDDWHLAKRQITWFKRNPKIQWLKLDEVEKSVIKYIQNE